MSIGRVSHTAAMLRSGKVLIAGGWIGHVLLAGGYANNDQATAQTWIYRP